MATLYIAEFGDATVTNTGAVMPTAKTPPLVEQTVAIGGASAASAAFSSSTRFVRLQADAVCSVAFGTAPVATATNARISANQIGEYFGVAPGSKVAVITNS